MSTHDFWIERLSDHLDGELTPDEAQAVEAHLAACPGCRTVRDELAEVRLRARALGGIAPARDLWAGIESRLSFDRDVLELTPRLEAAAAGSTVAGGASSPWRRGRAALRAAAVVGLLVATGATGWGLRAALDTRADRLAAATTPASVTPLDVGTTFAASLEAPVGSPEALARDVATLERLLVGDTSGLDANTIRVLRKNLAVIQTAIAESQAALELDPDNAYVRRHLEGTVERQRAFLRQATALLAADD